MTSAELLCDAYDRIRQGVYRSVEGITRDQLAMRINDQSNSIAWLVWHLARIQDDHIADIALLEQVWTSQHWVERFALSLDTRDTGNGHNPAQVAAVQVESATLLTDYYDAVHEQTTGFLKTLDDLDLDRVVDKTRTPAVSLGVRLMSVVADNLQHAGQASFLRGMMQDNK